MTKPRRVPAIEEGKERNDKEAKSESHEQIQGRRFGYKSETSSSHAKCFIRPQLTHKTAISVRYHVIHQESVAARRDNTWSQKFSWKPA